MSSGVKLCIFVKSLLQLIKIKNLNETPLTVLPDS